MKKIITIHDIDSVVFKNILENLPRDREIIFISRLKKNQPEFEIYEKTDEDKANST